MTSSRGRHLQLAFLSGLLWYPLWHLSALLADSNPEYLETLLAATPGAAFGALALVPLLPPRHRISLRALSLVGAGWLSYYLALSSLDFTDLEPFGLSVLAAGVVGVLIVLIAVRLLLGRQLSLRRVSRALLTGIAAGALVWLGLEIDDQLPGFGPSDYVELLIWPGHLLFNTLVCACLLETW